VAQLNLASPVNRVLSDQVTNQLREAIMQGQLKPGQHIVEREIAQGMRLSRGPVRDALRILENEGLVVRYPHRGTFVAVMVMHDAEEIYSLRQALETLAVDYAIKYATGEQLDELDRIVDRMAERIETNYTQAEATELDMQFHDALMRISGHTRLQTTWMTLRGQVSLLILTHRKLEPTDFREKGVEYHRQVVTCLRQRDAAAAHAVVRRHLASSFDTVAAAIRTSEARREESSPAAEGSAA
jgi:DNA-binding GntR family transcriptional regulator